MVGLPSAETVTSVITGLNRTAKETGFAHSDSIPFNFCMAVKLNGSAIHNGHVSSLVQEPSAFTDAVPKRMVPTRSSYNSTVAPATPPVPLTFGSASHTTPGFSMTGLGGLTVNAFTTAQSDGCPVTFPVCIAVMRYAPTDHAEGAVTDQPPSD
ncbi:hypothetical protein D3C71_1720080 [compost metagenome]